MTVEQVAALGPAMSDFLEDFEDCFLTTNTFGHFVAYCKGLLSNERRKSVEPLALAAGIAVRTLQSRRAGITFHRWDENLMRDKIQRRIVRRHLPPPGSAPIDGVGVVGLIDETGSPKKGEKTPGVQRQWCGRLGKLDNCIVTVHLGVRCGNFLSELDSDLFVPESWSKDRERCREAHIPDDVVHRSKWQIALEQLRRAIGNGVRFDWLTFDEWYGGKPEFLYELDTLGLNHVCEVPANFMCWPTLPAYNSPQAPFAAKQVDNACKWGKPFQRQEWREIKLTRQTLPPQTWSIKAAQVYLQRDGRPTDRMYWLIVAYNTETFETKYFVSNAPPLTEVTTLLKVAFTRWNVEHMFRLAKDELGFDHYEGRHHLGQRRHITQCRLMMLFVAEETTRLRGEKSTGDNGAGGAGVEHALRAVA